MKKTRVLSVILIFWIICGIIYIWEHKTIVSGVLRLTRQHVNEEEKLSLDDIFITVKTGGKYHPSRIQLILKTWWNYAKNQTHFFTDIDDKKLSELTGGRVINTKCGAKHTNADLCCKFGHEYDAFNESGKKWWCHFDDDNYVNSKLLLEALREYDWKSDYYIGRTSINHIKGSRYFNTQVKYWFATGGAGICISQSLSKKIAPWVWNGTFSQTCVNLHQADDCTIGFIINNLLGVNLTERTDFNSHIQNLNNIPEDKLVHQVTLSYVIPWDKKRKPIRINPEYKSLVFPENKDRTRFLSLHCLLHPNTEWCPRDGASMSAQKT